MRPRRAVAALAATLLVLSSCTKGDDVLGDGDAAIPEQPRDVDTASDVTEPTPTLELGPGQTQHTVGVTFQYGPFEVTVGDVVYDRDAQELLLGLRFRNLSDAWAMPETAAELRVGDTTLPVIGSAMDIPPRHHADVTWTVGPLAEDPVPDGELFWGRPDRDQPVVRLDGTGTNLWRRVPIELDGWAGIGKYSLHLTGGEILAASTRLGFQPPVGERVLRLVFDTYAHTVDPVNGFYPLEHMRLVRPDGVTVDGVASSPGFAPMAWTATAGNTIDFPISAEPAGDYVLELSSLSTNGLSTLHPALIERVAMPFTVPRVEAPSTKATEPRPVPDLTLTAPGSTSSHPITLQLDSGTVNVGGFLLTPTALDWDPSTSLATLTGTVTSIETATPPGMEDLVGGLLDIPPQFSFTVALVSAGRYFTGIIPSTMVDQEAPTTITIEFLGVDSLDTDDIGLVIGPREGAPSSLPLTAGSSVPSYPPPPIIDRIDAEPVSAGDWTIHIEGYRTGFLRGTQPPPPGMLDLEVFFTMTASPGATVRSLGLSFRPSVQVFLAQPDGYMQQPVADSGLVFYEPGESKRQSVTFHVPDIFAPGTYSFVLRSADESTEVTVDSFVETTFSAVLTDAAADDPGGL
ncbi:MAG TPA: hypothetical protein VF183_01630 [Acidimicrobiales bacterium]